MLTKEKVNRTLEQLPNSFTIDDLVDRIIFMEKVEAGLQQSIAGEVIENDEVKKVIDGWAE